MLEDLKQVTGEKTASKALMEAMERYLELVEALPEDLNHYQMVSWIKEAKDLRWSWKKS